MSSRVAPARLPGGGKSTSIANAVAATRPVVLSLPEGRRGIPLLAFLVCASFAVFGAVAAQEERPEPPIRTPAEFEPTQAVVMQWSYGEHDELHRFLVEHVQAAGAQVLILVTDGLDRRMISEDLKFHGLDLSGVEFLIVPTNTLWVRDYGGASIYYGRQQRAGFVDWRYSFADILEEPRLLDDDGPAVAVAALFGRTLFYAGVGAENPILDGGDFATDGFGTAFSSTRVVEDNGHDFDRFAKIIEEFMGIRRYIMLEQPVSDPNTNIHIDMYMKLLDEETLLVGEYRGQIDVDGVIEKNVEMLRTLPSCYGTAYRIVRIPMPGDPLAPDYRTYTNALIVNNYVLVPTYGVDTDEEALQVYRDAMPGYHVVGYDCSEIIVDEGAIHCITHEVKTEQMVRIAHARFTEGISVGEEIVVNARILSHEPVKRAHVHVKMPGQRRFRPYPMAKSGGSYSARIPATVPGEVKYYINACAGGVESYKPQNAYDGGLLTVNVVASEDSAR